MKNAARPGALLVLGLIGPGMVAVARETSPGAPAPQTRPMRRKSPAPSLDFSGRWRLDPQSSSNVSSHMENAVLDVSQKGDRIWINPARPTGSVMAEEIVADGKKYEKSLGTGQTGIVSAAWSDDRKSLRLQVSAGDSVQRSLWKLSDDRKVWVRETTTLQHGTRRSSRLVFRREVPGASPSPAATPPRD